jgi:hypothetical protein
MSQKATPSSSSLTTTARPTINVTVSFPFQLLILLIWPERADEAVWSNFEIGDLNFWRSEAYMKFFEYLDKAGGFYYERWGDAPVHSIGAALFAKKEQIHWFEDIGYKHEPFQVSYSLWSAFML